MASETFTASQVCQIVTGDDGDLDYMFPGSDDDLGMEDMDDSDELEKQAESESDADAEIESTDGNSPDVENSPPSPSETNSDNSTSGCCRGRGRSRGRGLGRGRGRRQGNQRCHEATTTSAEEEWSDGSSVQVQPFSMNVGPTFPLEEEPVAIFSTLFTPQLLHHIVAETNRYATLCLTSTHKGEGPPPTWETDANDILAYLGFAILMGINRVPDLYD